MHNVEADGQVFIRTSDISEVSCATVTDKKHRQECNALIVKVGGCIATTLKAEQVVAMIESAETESSIPESD